MEEFCEKIGVKIYQICGLSYFSDCAVYLFFFKSETICFGRIN